MTGCLPVPIPPPLEFDCFRPTSWEGKEIHPRYRDIEGWRRLLSTEEVVRFFSDLDILARGSSLTRAFSAGLANGILRVRSPLTATGSRRIFTGLPEVPRD